MIQLSLTSAFMLYLTATLAILLSLWLYHHYQQRKKKVDLSHHKLVVCEYCHFAFLRQIEKPIAQCPQCGSFNKERLDSQKKSNSNF